MPHDGPGEHYHDFGARIAGQGDTVVWTTVGLDIGSSTSQAVFSKITMARDDAYYCVVDRSVLHQSEIILTPYATPELIDRVQLANFVEREFAAANLTRAQIDTGAVIMTGLALLAQNARTIADILADDSGSFVAVSAGDMLEARLASNGAGVAELSLRQSGPVLHVDIGGGTTKMSIWRQGKLQRLAAIDVGARQLTLDAQRRVTKIEAPLCRLIALLNLDVSMGKTLSRDMEERIAEWMALAMLRIGGLLPEAADERWLLRTAPLFAAGERREIHAVVFSGGVSEYIYGRERREFGDLGRALGRAVRRLVEGTAIELLGSSQGIRATVLGASQHSTQLSGNTIFVSADAHLPLRNLPVLLPDIDLTAADLDAGAIARELEAALRGYASVGEGGFAIAVRWSGSATYERLGILADAIASAVDARLDGGTPCVVIVDGDIAGLLGARIRGLLKGRAVICLDGVHVHEFDHIDIGALGQHTQALPVVVKSLLFAQTGDHLHGQQ